MSQHTSKQFPLNSGTKLLALAALGLAATTAAHATLLSYESFSDYGSAGTELQSSLNPAVTGYTGSWTDIDFGNGEPSIQSGSLNYSGSELGDSVTTVNGNTVDTVGRVYRQLDATLTVDDTTTGTLYISYLFQVDAGADNYNALSLYNTNTADGNRYFDSGVTNNGGMDGLSYNFGVLGTYADTGVATDTSVHQVIAKFDLSATAASDSVTLWIDSTTETGGTTISGQDLRWDRIALSNYAEQNASWDEIRWGTTFVDVVPEPSTYALLAGLAALSFIAIRRRK